MLDQFPIQPMVGTLVKRITPRGRPGHFQRIAMRDSNGTGNNALPAPNREDATGVGKRSEQSVEQFATVDRRAEVTHVSGEHLIKRTDFSGTADTNRETGQFR